VVLAGIVSLTMVSCSSSRPSPYSGDTGVDDVPPEITDGRGRFREIFCAVLDHRAAILPEHRDCENALTRAGPEPDGTGRPVDLGRSDRGLVAAIVPGVGWDCIFRWLDPEETSVEHVRQFGFDAVVLDVDSLSSCSANARQIRDAIMASPARQLEPHLVLIGYSKGAPDILEAVVAYPEIRQHVAAVVSVAGAIRGSPVADKVTQSKLELLKHWPGAECTSGDGGAVESLRPATRVAWLADNPLPRTIPYYSLATCPEPDRISKVLKTTYKKLSRVDPRNDGMVLVADQIIPGSTFLGCVNADHWAVSVPIARTHPNIGSTFATKNDYPREALLEALLRFVEEDLAHPPTRMQDPRSKIQDPPPAR
jgi:hypothetical protein